MKQRPHLDISWIDEIALEIVERLQRAKFNTYLVGGCVRDLLAGIHPKDFDIVTTALPQDVKRLIPRSYIIGRRFRLVLVKTDGKQFEVATFRREAKPEELTDEFPSNENLFGTPEEDAERRDFTVNAIFYDPIRNELVDFCGGVKDIQDRLIRVIGDPDVRLKEDPIRILRAIRLSHKLHFSIEAKLRGAIEQNASELKRSVLPRKREEILKILKLDDPGATFYELHDLGVLKYISPTLESIFENPEFCAGFDSYIQRFHQIVQDASSPAQLFGTLLLAYYRCSVESDPLRHISHQDLLEDIKHKTFFRDELGMSNLEQRLFAKALHLQGTLKSVDRIRKRGERRQFAILSNEAFPLALLFARADHALTASELMYWENAYQEVLPKLQDIDVKARRSRRGPPRSRRPKQISEN